MLSFEGSGVKGIGFVGAIAVAEEKGFTWQNVAGTSAGAIVATLLASGYTTDEMREVSSNIQCSISTIDKSTNEHHPKLP